MILELRSALLKPIFAGQKPAKSFSELAVKYREFFKNPTGKKFIRSGLGFSALTILVLAMLLITIFLGIIGSSGVLFFVVVSPLAFGWFAAVATLLGVTIMLGLLSNVFNRMCKHF